MRRKRAIGVAARLVVVLDAEAVAFVIGQEQSDLTISVGLQDQPSWLFKTDHAM